MCLFKQEASSVQQEPLVLSLVKVGGQLVPDQPADPGSVQNIRPLHSWKVTCNQIQTDSGLAQRASFVVV